MFSDIYGYSSLKETLIKAICRGHFAHTTIFYGQQGSAVLSMALAVAKYLHCQEPTEGDVCGVCMHCNQHKKVLHPDLHLFFPTITADKFDKEELRTHFLPQFRNFILQNPYGSLADWGKRVEVENKQFSISVEDARSIIKNAHISAFMGGVKIILIWLPEYMNTSAANALLKILEEPPANTYFILVSFDMDQLLPTLLSRCQLVPVPLFSDTDILKYISDMQQVDSKKAAEIVSMAQGSLDRATKLVQEEYSSEIDNFAQALRWCFSRKIHELLKLTEEMSKNGREFQKNYLLLGIQTCRYTLLQITQAQSLIRLPIQETTFIVNFAKAVQIHQIEALIYALSEALSHIERNGNPKIVLFDMWLACIEILANRTNPE